MKDRLKKLKAKVKYIPLQGNYLLVNEDDLIKFLDNDSHLVENRVSQAASQAMPEPNASCENCAHKTLDNDKTSASKGEYYCEIHGKNLTDMFKVMYAKNKKLDYADIGCKQFEQK